MQVAEIVSELEALGWRQYPDSRHPSAVCLYSPRLVGLPDCKCNDKPPALYVALSDYEVSGYPIRGAEFEVFGENADGLWLKAVIYSVSLEEVLSRLPDVEAAARRIWSAFTEA